MSKMYALNRMRYGAAAGDPWLGSLLKAGGKLIGGLFKKKVPAAIAKVATSPAGRAVAGGVAGGLGWAAGEAILGGGGGRGASGSFGPRRAKGITARELRGYRKVANLLHREGMVSRRARGRK